MKIVKFKDGMYGIRRGFFWNYEFEYLSSLEWWLLPRIFGTPKRNTLEHCQERLFWLKEQNSLRMKWGEDRRDIGKVVK